MPHGRRTLLTCLKIGRPSGQVHPTRILFRLEVSNKFNDRPFLPWPLPVSRRASVESRTVRRLRLAVREVL